MSTSNSVAHTAICRVDPASVAGNAAITLVDVRPRWERYDGGVGVIPGSLALPGPEAQGIDWVRQQVQSSGRAVLVCLSGRRSAELAESWQEALDYRVCSLEGGVLAWRAEGYPVAALDLEPAPDSTPVDGPALRQLMQSCFVAQAAEMLVDMPGGDAIDPMQLLRRCFDTEGIDFDSPSADDMVRVIDRAAAISRKLGSDLKTIARNMDMIFGALGWTSLAPAPS